MLYVAQSTPYEAVYESGITGLVGIVEMKVVDNIGGTVTAASAVSITEIGTSGVYVAIRVAPSSTGQYTIMWSEDGSFDEETTFVEDLVVVTADQLAELGPLPPVGGQTNAPVIGPWSAWTTADDVAACCNDSTIGSDTSVLDRAIYDASGLLFELSGRRFAGSGQKTVRPCGTSRCFTQVLSRGHLVGGWTGSSWGYDDRSPFCGCSPLSRVPLSGLPARSIVEVLIDGAVVDPDTYRLDEWRWLTRVRETAGDPVLGWPACQALDLPATEVGTFQITYLFGLDPPYAGRSAADELACQLYKACSQQSDCDLPAGVTRVTRQGITFDRPAFLAFGRDRAGIWRTGLPKVDAFLNAYNPAGIRRRPAVMSPDVVSYARPVG